MNQELFEYKLNQIDEKVDRVLKTLRQEYVTRDVFDPLYGRVQKLEENSSWVVKLILGLVLTAIIGLVIAVK